MTDSARPFAPGDPGLPHGTSRGPAEAVAQVCHALFIGPAPRSCTRVVAIDGPSGAGKSTLAAALAHALDEAPLVPMDHLYPGWDGLAAAIPPLVDGVLAPLAAGRRAAYRRFDWTRGVAGAWHEVAAAPVVIVEGVGSGSLDAAPYLSLLVWLEAATDLRRDRGLARDGDTYRPHWDRWARQEETYVARHDPRSRADLRFDTTTWPPAHR